MQPLTFRLQLPHPSAWRGFTSVEVLVVLVLMAIIITLTVPAAHSVIQSYKITQAGILLQGKLSEAKQLSFSVDRPVQLRFCRDLGSTTSHYRVLQIFSLDPDGKLVATGRATPLPEGTVILASADYSSLMSLPEATANVADPAVGALRQQYAYRKFTIYPSGVTDLNPESKWFITIGDDRSSSAGKRPANFATIQIDPVNAISTVYNP